MKSEIINSKQAVCLAALYIAGSAAITGNAAWAGRDSWISLLMAVLLALPFYLVFARISSLFPECNFFDALYQIFGKFFGFFICLAVSVWFLLIGSLATRNFTEYVHVVSLGKTPQIFVAVCIAALCAYAVSRGLGVLGRTGMLAFALVAVTLIFTVIMLVPGMDFQNLLPVMATPSGEVASGAAAWFTFPLMEGFLLLGIMGGVRNEQSRYKIFLLALAFGAALLLTALLRNLLVFGGDMMKIMQFPSYASDRMISVGGFLQRVEAFVSANMLLCVFIRICVCVYAAARGLAKLTGTDNYRRLAFPVALLCAAVSPVLFSGAAEMGKWVKAGMYYVIPFQAALPVVIWLCAEIRTKRGKEKCRAEAARQPEPSGESGAGA